MVRHIYTISLLSVPVLTFLPSDSANGWTIEGYAGYNILHNLIAQTSYALVPQGQVFTNISGNVPQIQVPITSAAIDTLDILGFAEVRDQDLLTDS
jgi:hypothetical protein